MRFEYDDGGREAAGYKGKCGDCVTRAITIATGKPYQEVYDAIAEIYQGQRLKKHRKASGRDGTRRQVYEKYLRGLGWVWTPTMGIGQGCKVHLRERDLPTGRLIVRVSKHMCAVIDHVIRDTFDDQREGTRCVYGYWSAPKGTAT